MSITIARLRQVILVLAGLLVVVILGFLLYARYRLRSIEKDLPARLGINIQQTANGYTYSQSSKGHTLYTIHASRLIQYKEGGKATLHDVAITLYGPAGSNRVDKIYGSDFSYDAKNQIVSAQGTVLIDLQGFGSGSQSASPQNILHVKTSGLVFNQKTAQADTPQYTEFSFPKASGSSVGAHYNGKTGILVLDSQVELTTSTNGNPAIVHASHAQILRDSKQAFLLSPQTDYRSQKGTADTAVVDFRPDGSLQTIDANGHVRIVTADGAVITSSNSVTQLNEKSQPVQTDVTGGVTYVSTTPRESMHGTAASGMLTFGPDSMLKHAQFSGGVSFADQVFHLANDPKGTASRHMHAATLDIDFAPGPDPKKSVAHSALAVGDAVVTMRTNPSKGPQELTTVSGDQLLALLTPDGKAIRQLNGTGHTKVIDLPKDGSIDTTTGDRLEATFNTQKPSKSNTATQSAGNASQTTQASQIDNIIQDGNVVLTQTPQKKAGATTNPATVTAWAQRAEYHASDQVLHLTGNPRLYDGQSLQMAALRIDYHRDTGDAVAFGSVQATYTQQKTESSAPSGPTLGGNGPVHITADHAFLRHATDVSTFYGSDSTDARIWQGASSILAPVIELTRTPQTLKAYGAPGSTGPVVSANLPSATSSKSGQGIVRVKSRTLLYSDADRRADFHGDVTAEDPDGIIHADQALIYLTPAPKKIKGQQNQQTQLDYVIATGHVALTQPGRKGTGEKLVYTADDGRYVLTGSPGNPPRVEDAVKGTTTGATLIFNSQDDSVVVSGGQSSAVTQTRTPE